ncbi:MAG: M23 family metallopeptidase [Candidatus Pacebacteria bacterium]|nr:M23 family metallopeptidase [Candidatus Paceibacterota bacterium]
MVAKKRRVHKHFLIQRNPLKSRVLVATNAKHVMTYRNPSTIGRGLEVVAGLMLVAVPLSVHAGVFSLFMPEASTTAPVVEVIATDSVLDTPVLVAATNPDPSSSRGGSDLLVQDGVLVSTGPIGADEQSDSKSAGEISVYTVREGDSLSMIAEMFDVTSNTILWANDLTSAKAIKPGQTLIILPIAGVRHVVKSGDTIASIAKKYEGDTEEILAYNQLEAGQELSVGATVIVPGGALHATAVAKPIKTAAGGATRTGGSFSHPAPGAIKTQGIHGYNAVDFASSIGTPIRAAAAGEVIVSKSSGWNGGYGQYIVVRHANGSQTLYAHLSANNVSVGATVGAGEVIGAMGNTGKSTGPHLHFEVRGAKNPF